MAILTFELILFSWLAGCSGTNHYPTNIISQNTKENRLLRFGLDPTKDLAIFYLFSDSPKAANQIQYRSKRNIRTQQPTTQLTVLTSEIMQKIFSPNYKWDELFDLQFDNSNGSLCKDDFEIITDCDVILPRLKYLYLNNFANCETLFDSILSCLEASQLSTLKVNGQIDVNFMQQFLELFRKNYDSLTEISLSGTLQTRLNIFEMRANYTLNNVSTIFIRLRQKNHEVIAKNIVNNRFCSIFPNLVKLGIKQTIIDIDQVLRLQRCSKLKYLKAVIHVERHEIAGLLQIDWKSVFPDLENIALKLMFDECPSPSTFEQLTGKLSNFRKYILCSNCNLAVYRNIKCTQGSKGTY